MSAISVSERKRLESLKEKKQAFKAREQIIRQALTNLDNNKNKNKIIFDDNFDEQDLELKEKKKRDLFDNDEADGNNEETLWNEDEFSVKKHKKTILGNDTRFTLCEKFVEDDVEAKETKVVEDINEYNLQKEKEKELEILGTVLGVPFKLKNRETKIAKNMSMIRYDPTESEHRKYEIKHTEVEEIKEKKIKKKHGKSKIEETAPVEVSKDIYYTVSDNLSQSFKQKGEFSLLKMFGRDKDDTDVKDYDAFTAEDNKKQRSWFNFSTEDTFKCDSSDNKNTDETSNVNKKIDNQVGFNNHILDSLIGSKDTLFFDTNDIRFNEAVKFFSTTVIPDNDFKKLRRELKMIVRKKIRRNEKRHEPWGKKKIKKS